MAWPPNWPLLAKKKGGAERERLKKIALTSIVMKTFEKLAGSEMLRKTKNDQDPLWEVGEATVTLFDLVLFKHLKGKRTHAASLFFIFHLFLIPFSPTL